MKEILVCTNLRVNPGQPSCGARGALSLADRLSQEIAAHGWEIGLELAPCLGRCDAGPNVKLSPGGPLCSGITPEGLEELLRDIEAFVQAPDPTDQGV